MIFTKQQNKTKKYFFYAEKKKKKQKFYVGELCEWTKDGTEWKTQDLIMKWPSANSTDRKSVFYTSEDSAKILASTKVC